MAPRTTRDEHALTGERHTWLAEQIADTGRVTTNEAADRLGVSVDTIRRDLRLLHDRGLLRRVHGGAMALSRLPDSYTARVDDDSSGRSALALAVVDQFRSGQVIGLDGGSTCAEIASLIPQTLAVTIVTNNPAAVVGLADHQSVEVIVLGGMLDLTWMATVGSDVVDGWRNYHLDLAVLGVCGLDPVAGATTNSSHEVATKRALIASGAEVIIPVQDNKIGEIAPFVVASLESITTVVTQRPTDDPAMKAMRQAGIETLAP